VVNASASDGDLSEIDNQLFIKGIRETVLSRHGALQ
jgi:hypothetical protein